MKDKKTALVILGASGDLSRRKLLPALARLHRDKRLPADILIAGTGRTRYTDGDFRREAGAEGDFSGRLRYHQGIPGIKKWLDDQGEWDQYVLFLALPPGVYGETAEKLYQEGFRDRSRLVIEKPFGYDTASARRLNEQLHRYYREDQIFRIDHYLAKEAVQNLLVFRFANCLFEPLWNSRGVDNIQINASETLRVQNRGAYFDRSGILRDMIQNHLLQLLLLLTMDAPASLGAADIQSSKDAVLKSLRAVRGRVAQYGGYRRETGVSPHSRTPTYAEIELAIDSPRWGGVPVYLRTGKALSRSGIEIAVTFKPQRKGLDETWDRECSPSGCRAGGAANRVVFTIQPFAGILVDMVSKKPGEGLSLQSSRMDFCYGNQGNQRLPDAYERLLQDAVNGDRTLFVSGEETVAAWQVMEPLLDLGRDSPPAAYAPGEAVDLGLIPEPVSFAEYGGACRIPKL